MNVDQAGRRRLGHEHLRHPKLSGLDPEVFQELQHANDGDPSRLDVGGKEAFSQCQDGGVPQGLARSFNQRHNGHNDTLGPSSSKHPELVQKLLDHRLGLLQHNCQSFANCLPIKGLKLLSLLTRMP